MSTPKTDIPDPIRDFCPTCNQPTRSWCRCLESHRICANGHTWKWQDGRRVIVEYPHNTIIGPDGMIHRLEKKPEPTPPNPSEFTAKTVPIQPTDTPTRRCSKCDGSGRIGSFFTTREERHQCDACGGKGWTLMTKPTTDRYDDLAREGRAIAAERDQLKAQLQEAQAKLREWGGTDNHLLATENEKLKAQLAASERDCQMRDEHITKLEQANAEMREWIADNQFCKDGCCPECNAVSTPSRQHLENCTVPRLLSSLTSPPQSPTV